MRRVEMSRTYLQAALVDAMAIACAMAVFLAAALEASPLP
jgi:hypothetical protein